MSLWFPIIVGICLVYLWVRLVKVAVEADKRDKFVKWMRGEFRSEERP